ncbi:hypothetical protein J7E71_07945 [Mesobacillus foraminis]|uniref:DUF6610 family protein n=1 Tax=Mesobacillus foraminis TaxID=279826 RepID=UPI001BEAEB9A|nr:DUF6610 family protein [Mesobacillus foraminis]MBT2755878.1 hypothetical protein [Mesobacillus foraminis]
MIKNDPFMIVCHNKNTINIAKKYGWLPGAKYTNLRDIKTFSKIGLIDIDWQNYDFKKHLDAVKSTNPLFTVARDIENINELDMILDQAYELSIYAQSVIVVPKDIRLKDKLNDLIPKDFILGYSVPTKYGGTEIPTSYFQRPVHLLGGRPDVQRRLGDLMPVISFDCNRFTLDASFGDYFDGEKFRPHPQGGYKVCLEDSIRNTTDLWSEYKHEQEDFNGYRISKRISIENV